MKLISIVTKVAFVGFLVFGYFKVDEFLKGQ